MKWIVAIIIFGVLIFFHEFGHFIIAKLNGVAVDEFSIGFGPRILTTVKGGTRYSLKLIIFGGSCIMKGMIPDELLEDDRDETEEESYGDTNENVNVNAGDLSENSGVNVENVIFGANGKNAASDGRRIGSGYNDEDSFNSKPVGRRLAIIFAGPFFNFLLAFIAAIVLISIMGYDPPEVSYVAEGTTAEAAGVEVGDEILSVNGKKISISRDIDEYFLAHETKSDTEINLEIKRGGEKIAISFLPDSVEKYMLGISYSQGEGDAVLSSVSKDSPAKRAGLEAGDVITRINDTEISTGEELADYMEQNPVNDASIVLYYVRKGSERKVEITPEVMTNVSIGFGAYAPREKVNPAQVLKYSFIEVRYWIGAVYNSLKMLVTGRFGIEVLSGPVGIVDVIGETYEESSSQGTFITWMNMLYLLILLSANVGAMNLLPFPILDGGRIVFLLIEAVIGRKVNPKVENTVNFIGAVLLMALMVFVLYNDIARLL